jgi:hypothetical protein
VRRNTQAGKKTEVFFHELWHKADRRRQNQISIPVGSGASGTIRKYVSEKVSAGTGENADAGGS